MNKKLIGFFAGSMLLATVMAGAQTTYTWDGSTDTDFGTASNWTPDRTVPATNDILQFDGGGTFTVTGVTTQTIGKIILINSSQPELNAATADQRLTLTGGAGSLIVNAGSKLNFSNTQTGYTTIILDTGCTGTVSGGVRFKSAVSAPNRILVKDVGALVFTAGSTMEMAPFGAGGGGGFGGTGVAPGFTLAVEGVVFQSGSTATLAGNLDGSWNGGTGSNPFSAALPNQLVKFESGSTWVAWDGIPSISGRTFGTFRWQGSSANQSNTGSSPWIVLNDTIFGTTPGVGIRPADTGPKNFGPAAAFTAGATFNGNFTCVPGGTNFVDLGQPTVDTAFNFKGNLSVAAASQFVPTADPERIYAFNGTGAQDINAAGITMNRVEINNAAGLTFSGDLTVGTNLNITGTTPISQTTGKLILAQAATVTGSPLTANPIYRAVNVGAAGSANYPFPSTPVDITVTATGTGTGTISVNQSAVASTGLPGGSTGINRKWVITETGVSGATYTLVLSYQDTDYVGLTEANFKAARFNGSTWDIQTGNSTVDTGLNTVTVTGVTAFSEWTIVDPGSSVGEWTQMN